jgi:hypothetical protein
MILLGAGASKVFGLKTLQDLTTDLVNQMKEKGHEETILFVISALKRFEITPDFENIYITLEALSDPLKGVKKSGAFTAYIAHKAGLELERHPEFAEILSDFRDLIYKECTIQRGVIEDKKAVFDRLFYVASQFSETRNLPSITGASGDRQILAGDTIVTTNYDMGVELYHFLMRQNLADGFKITQNIYTKELDLFEFGRNATFRWLIKLHGSIWQFQQSERIIKTIADPKSLPLNISVGEQMMIYPVGEKPILQHPYFSFYYLFKEQPWLNLIAIGHSFRDQPINVAITERFRNTAHTRNAKLIVVNPDAENAVENLGPIGREFDDMIFRISDSFEDDKMLFDKIVTALASKDRKEYEMRTRGWHKLS